MSDACLGRQQRRSAPQLELRTCCIASGRGVGEGQRSQRHQDLHALAVWPTFHPCLI